MSSFASEKIEFIDFSDNHFESLPLSFLARSSQTLSQLHLSNNWISNIQALNFTSFTALRTLDLSSNRLSELFDECFEGLADLSNLKLSNNSIYQVGITVFDSVPQLTGLDLSHNALVEVPIALGRLFKLRHLNISRNQISKTYKFLFNKLPHLRILDLSHNNLPTIDSYVFSDLPRLTDLFLSHNSIGSIVREGFVKCPRLQMIDLSNNFLSSLNGAFNGVYSLKRLILSYNTMEVLQWTELPATLSTLLIDHNRITLLGSAVKSQVTHAELQHNHLMVLSADQIPETMENLNVSCNAIHTIINHTFAKKSGLKSLDLTFNSLSILKLSSIIVHSPINPVPTRLYVQGNPLICTCEMEWMMRSNTTLGTNFDIIDLALTNCKNRIDNGNMVMAHISTADLLCVYNLACEPECICCQYGNCDCKSKCPDGCQCYHDATYMTNIVRCSSLVGHDRKNFSPKDLPMYATHVYLEGMNIPVIRSHDFLGRIRLVHLHINDSGVREIQPLAFNTLSSLKLLDLSGNKLDRLLGDEMFRTEKVTHLFLNDNRLTLLNTRVTEVMPSLQVVALHNNLLTELPTAIEQLTPSLVQVSLSSNPYRCDCSNRFRMQYWLPQHVDRVVDAERIFCVENVTKAFQGNDTTVLSAYPPNHGKHLFIMPMAEFIAEFNSTLCVAVASGVFGTKTAANSALMTAMLIAIFLVGVALILLGITMLRRVQATIAQRRYKAPPSLNCSHPTQGSSPMPLIHFDAFVSYSNMDEKLVIDFLCRQLEAQDYLLCLLHRDGPAYNTRLHSISDELIKQMECSQSLIIVVTNNFLENEWKTLQIKTSHQLFAKNRYKKLIAVLSDDIEPNRFDTELGQILRKNTCIRMNDPLFWNLLHSALPVRMSPSTYSGDSMQIYSDCYGGIVPSDVI
ncbi:hypothetical protein AB6A40_001351 [Gnathostoma spinigerum]|uniref:TIR domain-containing protein n=1 Tax=Gnathostoma spinigerum TaxID=75299 RepID=A0ABD6ED75_9BILA